MSQLDLALEQQRLAGAALALLAHEGIVETRFNADDRMVAPLSTEISRSNCSILTPVSHGKRLSAANTGMLVGRRLAVRSMNTIWSLTRR